jgi:internalin A
LYSIKTLENLTLNCNPIQSIEGIEALQNLNTVILAFTDVNDISPLFQTPSIEHISVENTYVSSIEGIENLKHLYGLRIGNTNITDISPLNKIDYSYINDTDGFNFEAKNSLVRDFSPLQNIPIFNEVMVNAVPLERILPYISGKQVNKLYLTGSDIRAINQLSSIQDIRILDLTGSFDLTSIDGIENHTDLAEVNLTECPELTDLTPLLQLPNLERLILGPDMENLAAEQLAGANFEIIYQEG